MNEEIELEVSLEIIMSEIADAMFKLTDEPNIANEEELTKLIEIQKKAYKGDRRAVKQILLK